MTTIVLLSGLNAGCLASSLLSGDCPPGTFDYGPPLPDVEIAEIVLDHYGPDGPIVPTPDDYARASRDVSLIREFVPFLTESVHQPDVPYGYFYVAINDPDDEELACMNAYYAAGMGCFFHQPPFTSCIVKFPHSVNVLPLMVQYQALPAVDAAFPDSYGCPAAGCCSNHWAYTELGEGIWQWRVKSGTGIGPGGAGCLVLEWVFTVSGDGAVSQSPDLNGDGIVDGVDLGELINEWGSCPGITGGHCPADLDGDGGVAGSDLAILLGMWS